jgi:3'(2'), 5'-bisphosphate nucleotidase
MKLPNESFSKEMNLAVRAALKAGEQVMSVYNGDFAHTIKKEDNSPVTEADIASDKVIHEELSKTGYPILSEESKDPEERLSHKRVWIVDPLDGTSDFVNKTGEFSIMIALVDSGVPILGVVYNPVQDILYISERGKGAYQHKGGQWQKIQVSSTADVAKSRAVVSRHHLMDEEKSFLKKLGISDFVQHGSGGLKISKVANGEAELYFAMTDNMKQWDTAAAFSIITEAGGRITDMNGREFIYNTEDVYHKNGILVTNGLMHNLIIRGNND